MLSCPDLDTARTIIVGDVQGCYDSLRKLLKRLGFSPPRDRLVLLGDLVNRGAGSLAVLGYASSLGRSCSALLGNHDLHLLAVAHGVRQQKRGDTLDEILRSKERAFLLRWLRQQRLALKLALPTGSLLCVHAGVLPQWTQAQTLGYARELERVVQGESCRDFLTQMYGNTPDTWQDELSGMARLRVITNALTRLRFCSAQGQMEFETKEGAGSAPAGFVPWFEVPGRKTRRSRIAFGHWSTLGLRCDEVLVALDTGCVWGGRLSALVVSKAGEEVVSVKAAEAQTRQP